MDQLSLGLSFVPVLTWDWAILWDLQSLLPEDPWKGRVSSEQGFHGFLQAIEPFYPPKHTPYSRKCPILLYSDAQEAGAHHNLPWKSMKDTVFLQMQGEPTDAVTWLLLLPLHQEDTCKARRRKTT